MIISIASGKGGTGKTTIAASFARSLAACQFLDCDVEEPNAALFLKPSIDRKIPVSAYEPRIDETTCTHCEECSKICAFHAIAVFGKTIFLFPNLCHGCGGCVLVCPEKAITEGSRNIGFIEEGINNSITFVQGVLNVGEHMATPVIKEMKKLIRNDTDVVIDSPPGTSCPMIESVKGSDFVVLVAEPTPFGLNDLTLAVEVIKELNIPFGVIINSDGIGDDRVEKYCLKEHIPLLLRVPWNRKVAEAYSRGIPAVEVMPDLKERLLSVYQEIAGLVESNKSALTSKGLR